jgi:exosortase/archaeosortase family protein
MIATMMIHTTYFSKASSAHFLSLLCIFFARARRRQSGVGPVFALTALILGFEPFLWLVRTWLEPSYASQGFYVFLVCAGLFVWSLTSPREVPRNVRQQKTALALFAVTAVVRLAGQLLAVNTIGALALVLDVFALGLLFGLKERRRKLFPGWLAVAFAFSLPLERIAQRTIGYGLQSLSSDGACLMLGGLYDDLKCNGVRIVLEGRDILVDLPCSGARSILLLLLCFALVSSLVRPGFKQAFVGGMLTLLAGLFANMVRISVLAIGIARPQVFFGLDVMAQPWHDVIGLMALALGAAPLLVWGYRVAGARPAASIDERCRCFLPDRLVRDGWWLEETPCLSKPANRWFPALLFMSAALIIVNLPRQAFDVTRRSMAIELPQRLAGAGARPIDLLVGEKAYFLKYGGSAQKAGYGPHQLLVVRTSAPLRHLHAPDECLRGLGMDVQYLGARHSPVPTAVYRATTPEGQAYRIDVSFLSDEGFITTNISEAVWRWMQNPRSTWSAIQRITPEHISEDRQKRFEAAVIAALDLPRSPLPIE